MSILVLLVALTAIEPKDCQIADPHFYAGANIERFPAVGIDEMDWTAANQISRQGGVYFEITMDRCSKRPVSLMKYQAGKAVYGYYYRYKDGRLVGLDLRYIDGTPTVKEILDRI
jgi:hypothetical protein